MTLTALALFRQRYTNLTQGSVLGPIADFFAVGGFSVLIIAVVWLVGNDVLQAKSASIAWFAYAISFFINYPHFAYSYQILYENYFTKLMNPDFSRVNRLRYLIAGIVSPLVLLIWLGWGLFTQDRALLGYSVNAMYFFVGWHYIKQGFGILVVLSARKKIYFSPMERFLLLTHAYTAWIYNWMKINAYAYTNNFNGIPYTTFDMPDGLIEPAKMLLITLGILMTVAMALKFVSMQQSPPVSAFTGYLCAIYPWTLFPHTNIIFVYLVPAMHSLQYLVFVWKMKSEKLKDENGLGKRVSDVGKIKKYRRQLFWFLGLGVVLGAAGFYSVPTTLDRYMPLYTVALGGPAFIFAFNIFINIHHYFIDSAIWRRDNPDLKYLFH